MTASAGRRHRRVVSLPTTVGQETTWRLPTPARGRAAARSGPAGDGQTVTASTDTSDTSDARDGEPSSGIAPRRRPASPEQTRDDTDAGWGERPDRAATDRWLRSERPPHWE